MWVFIMFYNHLVLQEAMRKAEAAGSDDCPVKIKLVAPPLYVLTTQTLDKVGATSTYTLI
jgi:translation initiation factor 2 subunit 1